MRSFAFPAIGLLVLLVSGYLVADFASKIEENKAYGSFENGIYFCDPEILSLAKREYRDEVNLINNGVDFFNGPIPETNDYILGSSNIVLAGQMAECLKEKFNVEPDSVAMFSDRTQDVLGYDMPRLMEVAPDLVNYATVPEFGSTTILVTSMSVLATVLFYKKFF